MANKQYTARVYFEDGTTTDFSFEADDKFHAIDIASTYIALQFDRYRTWELVA